MPSVTLNYSALADLCCYIKEKLQEGYELFSLDETGFGSASLQKYCWIEKGKEVYKYDKIYSHEGSLTKKGVTKTWKEADDIFKNKTLGTIQRKCCEFFKMQILMFSRHD